MNNDDNLKYNFLYSPRTNYNNQLEKEQKLYVDLSKAFDPYSIKILKKHFKEHLGLLNKETFVCIIKRHLLSWKPDLPNRDNIIIKLLSRLFDEIDINSNGQIEWKDFVKYIITISNININEKSLYSLQNYNQSKTVINHQDINENSFRLKYISSDTDIVSYCFYIEKYKLVGIVHEGKPKIKFYNAEKRKMEISEIDLIEIEKEINECEMKEFNLKAEKLIKKEEEEEKERKLKAIGKLKLKIKNDNDRSPTPDNVKREISKINNGNQNYDNYKHIKFYPTYACFADDLDILFISSSNNKISAWKYNEKKSEFKNVNNSKMDDYNVDEFSISIPLFSCELPQYAMCFDNILKVLYSGQEDGKIFQWDLNSSKPVHVFEINDKKNSYNTINTNHFTRKIKNMLSLSKIERNLLMNDKKKDEDDEIKEEKSLNYMNNQEEKNKTVSCLLLISNLRLLCSSYYTGQIILWDTISKKPKKIYNDQKTIVYQVVYNPFKNRIYTCGFEHEIHVYDPYNDENDVQKLKGHMTSISSMSFNKEINELISIDIQGIMKIWDANNFVNFQTLNIKESLTDELNNNKQRKKNNFKLNSNYYVIALTNVKQIIVYGENNLILFEKGRTTNPLLCDDSIILGCIFDPYSNEIITISTQRIKFWNLLNGKVNKIYEDLMNGSEISAFELDKRNKKCYIGDNNGKIRCYNLINGILLKEFKSHSSNIINIFHSMKYKTLITSSIDLCIRFHSGIDDNEDIYRETYVLNNSDNDEKKTIKKILLNEDDNMLIIALSNGWISYYDFNYNKFINDKVSKNEPASVIKRAARLSNITDLPNIKCLFSSYENGDRYIITKINNKNYYLLSGQKFGNFIEEEKENNDINEYKKKNIVYSSIYDESTYRLITGDHSGFITCFNMKILNEILDKEYNSKEEILSYIKNNLNIPYIFRIQPYKQSITHLNIPLNLNPKIFITVGSDSIVKLFNFENAEYIESLKQISIRYTSVPVAIKFLKENPFGENINKSKEEEKEDEEEYHYIDDDTRKRKEEILKTINEINNNFKHYSMINEELNNEIGNKFYDEEKESIIYRCEIEHNLKIPKIDYINSKRREIINYSNELLEYNAKMKLQSQIMGQKIMPSKSSPWNYDFDFESILKKEKEDLRKLYIKMKEKEKDIKESENNFQHVSLINNNYIPNFLNNLKYKEKKNFSEFIKDKLRIIDLSNTKKNILIKEENEIVNHIEKHRYPHILTSLQKSKSNNKEMIIIENNEKNEKDKKEKINKNKINDKKLKLEKNEFHIDFRSLNTIDNVNSKRRKRIFYNKSLKSLEPDFRDLRFLECKNKFDERYNEIENPLKLIMLKKYPKRKVLPKLSLNIIK